MKFKKPKLGRYFFDFISVFFAVIAAFALNNWNENRRDHVAESKILIEMSNGLAKDISDIENNIYGHKNGIKACKYWRKVVFEKEYDSDSLQTYYYELLRGFFPVQNKSGFETLKSRGLELIKNDSLRHEILNLYDYQYYILKRQEENSYEFQFNEEYSPEINKMLSKNFLFDENGNIIGIENPLDLSEDEKKLFSTILWNLQINREIMIQYYRDTKLNIELLRKKIKREQKSSS